MTRAGRGATESFSALTDASGRYEVRHVAAGSYSVVASKGGFEARAFGQRARTPLPSGASVEVGAGAVVEAVDIVLPRGAVIAGTVVDEFGEPLEGAEVLLAQARYVDWQRRLTAVSAAPMDMRVRTNDVGQFRIYGLAPGEYYLGASTGPAGGRAVDRRAGYALTYYPGTVATGDALPVTVRPGDQILGLVIPLVPARRATISGFITGGGGSVLTVNLHLTSIAASGGVGTGAGVLSSTSTGTFSFNGLPPGAYALRAWAIDAEGVRLTGTATAVLEGTDVDNLALVLNRAVTARGRVVFEGEPPAQLGVVRVTPVGNTGPAATAPIGKDGTFDVAGVERGAAHVHPVMNGWFVKRQLLRGADVTDDPIDFTRDVDGLEIHLARGLTHLAGSVVDARGNALANATVVVFAEDRQRWTFATRYVVAMQTTADGQFDVRSLPPGRYVVVVADDYQPGDETDPRALEAWTPRGTRVTLSEGALQRVQLREGP